MHDKYWFKRRRYGYGWTPSTWQGWLVLAVFLLGIALLVLWLVHLGDSVSTRQIVYYLCGIGLLVGILVVISFVKGPKPKWRWGSKSDDTSEDW